MEINSEFLTHGWLYQADTNPAIDVDAKQPKSSELSEVSGKVKTKRMQPMFWKENDDQKLQNLIRSAFYNLTETRYDWPAIAHALSLQLGRTVSHKQCRERYVNHLDECQ